MLLSFLFFLNIYLLFIWLPWVLVVARRLFIAVRGLWLWLTGSVVVLHWLGWSPACGISAPRPGMEPGSPPLQGGFLTSGPPGKPLLFLYDLYNHIKFDCLDFPLFTNFFVHHYLKNFFNLLVFNWRRIALQYCDGFCHILT